MSVEIVPFSECHLNDAAVLVTTRYRVERDLEKSLPAQFEQPDSVLPRLQNYANQRAGVAAIRNGRLVGFLVGLLILNRGRRLAWSPDWGHAAESNDSREIYHAMYARLAPRWLANGCFTHAITALAHDRTTIDTWFSLGFGLITVDALRDIDPVPDLVADIEIRRALLEEIDHAMNLEVGLRRYIATAPIFIPFIMQQEKESYAKWLSDSANALLLAYHNGDAVSFMRLQPSAYHVLPISDKATVAITGAFTKANIRRSGIGTALLNHSLDWARSVGYRYCSVDYESTNILGSHFWQGRGFKPVCYSLVRHIDEIIAWANEDRDDADLLREF